MRIAQVAPLFESVPPKLYGGTERVVSYLTEELVRQGHEVTLFASGDSVTAARLVAVSERSLRLDTRCLDQLAHVVRQLEEVFRRLDEFDVVHFHNDYIHYPLSRRYEPLRLTTLHGRLDIADLVPLYREYPHEPVVSISDAQRQPLPHLNWLATIQHGLPPDLHRFHEGPGRHLAFVGRLSPEKRPDEAIRMATRFGMPLKIAAKLEEVDRPYFEARVRPLLDDPLVEWMGEVDERGKEDLIGGAYALLFPVDWPEPFGLVMIEAMACGTPVVAYRRGAVPEVMREGVTGFVVAGADEAVKALGQVSRLDRGACRRVFEERYLARRMAADYAALYERIVEDARGSPRRRTVLAGPPAERPDLSPPAAAEGFPILAMASLADEHRRVLKQGDTFAVFDHYGDVANLGLGEQGLFHQGTRFLSKLELRLGRSRPLFLSSTVKEANDLLLVDLANPDVPLEDGVALPRGTVHLFRGKLLREAVAYERVRISNHGLSSARLTLVFRFGADFADIFEVRGTRRERRGEDLAPRVEGSAVVLSYRGLDGVTRRTRLEFSPAPSTLSSSAATFDVGLDPQAETSLFLAVACETDGQEPARVGYEQALGATEDARRRVQAAACRIETSSEPFNRWLERSTADLHMMVTDMPSGPYPYAGVPWFSTPFGRDGIITAMEVLWMDPSLARGVLSYLSATQATEVRPEQDAEPGKILHETRGGEMAALGEVPFGRYYGSVDATPLFVMLAGQYYARTGDHAFIESLWPSVERALGWIDRYGDADQDGFVEYARRSPAGLVQQGWKDSGDSVSHADGRLAEGPIALCEVQGYVYAARQAASELATALGHAARADALLAQAELRRRFEEAFWDEELGTYALALDGEKRPCRVATSNAGHGLFAGIASPARALRVATRLFDTSSFSGWGVRTLAAGERRYNPMSYHNGSVWPHDNALVGAGLGRYGLRDELLRLLGGLFDASSFFDLHRMPELFCGFKRRGEEGPTLYPVACAPQSWAACAVFLLLQACLGLTVDGRGRQLLFVRPALPAFLDHVRIENLRVGEARVDLVLDRHETDVGINIARREGPVEVVTIK